MNIYILEPLKSVGNIIFSEDRNIVRSVLGKYTEFKKTKFSKNTTDDFGFCQVFYDCENRCEAVEFTKKYVKVTYGDIVLTDLGFSEAKTRLYSLDETIEINDNSVTSNKLGISIYAPNNEVESLLFFRNGYFD